MKNLIFLSLALSLIFLPACKTRKRKRKGVETSQSEKDKTYDKIILYADKKDEKTKKIEDQIRDRLVKSKTPENKKPEVLTVSSSKELKESVGLEDRALVINLDSPQKETLEQEDSSQKNKKDEPTQNEQEKSDLLIPSQADFEEEQTQSDDTEIIASIVGAVFIGGALAYKGRQRYERNKSTMQRNPPPRLGSPSSRPPGGGAARARAEEARAAEVEATKVREKAEEAKRAAQKAAEAVRKSEAEAEAAEQRAQREKQEAREARDAADRAEAAQKAVSEARAKKESEEAEAAQKAAKKATEAAQKAASEAKRTAEEAARQVEAAQKAADQAKIKKRFQESIKNVNTKKKLQLEKQERELKAFFDNDYTEFFPKGPLDFSQSLNIDFPARVNQIFTKHNQEVYAIEKATDISSDEVEPKVVRLNTHILALEKKQKDGEKSDNLTQVIADLTKERNKYAYYEVLKRKEKWKVMTSQEKQEKIKELQAYQEQKRVDWGKRLELRFEEKFFKRDEKSKVTANKSLSQVKKHDQQDGFNPEKTEGKHARIDAFNYTPSYQQDDTRTPPRYKKGDPIPKPKKAVFLYPKADHNGAFSGFGRDTKRQIALLSYTHKITYIRVRSVDDIKDELEKATNGDKKIDYLVVGGHGKENGRQLRLSADNNLIPWDITTLNLKDHLEDGAPILLDSCSQGSLNKGGNLAGAFSNASNSPVLAPMVSAAGASDLDLLIPHKFVHKKIDGKAVSYITAIDPLQLTLNSKLRDELQKLKRDSSSVKNSYDFWDDEEMEILNMAWYFDAVDGTWNKVKDDSSPEEKKMRLDFLRKNSALYSKENQEKVIELMSFFETLKSGHRTLNRFNKDQMEKIEEFDLYDEIKLIKVGEEDDLHLNYLHKFRSLENMYIKNKSFNDLTPLQDLENLRLISLEKTKVTQEKVEAFNSYRESKGLRKVEIFGIED